MVKHLIIAIMVLLSVPAMAQGEDSVAHQVRFGYLSYETALAAMPEYEGMLQQMNTLREAYEKGWQRVENEFNRKYEDFLEGQKEFPRTILLKRQTELQDLMQKNLAFKKQGEADLAKAERDLKEPLRARLNETIATLAHQHHLALVINTDANACPFIEPSLGVDLNEEVISKLKK